MQALLREKGPGVLRPSDMERFVSAYQNEELIKPEVSGYVIAALVTGAPASLSGQFVSWNSPELKDFRRPDTPRT